MPNNFNTTGLPAVYVIGDTIVWEDYLGEYNNSEYTVSYIFSGGITVTGVDFDDGWKFTITSTTLATVGQVRFNRVVTEDSTGNRTSLDSGVLEVRPDPEFVTETTQQSHAVTTFKAIQLVLQGRASVDQMGYSIAGRRLDKTPISDLLSLRDYYSVLVKKERKRALAERGEGVNDGRVVVFDSPTSSRRSSPFRR